METKNSDVTSFKKYGETFTQIKRKGQVAIYERSKEGQNVKQYEVVILKDAKEYTLAGVTISAKEDAYPGTNAFGKLGWSAIDLPQAEKKFLDVLKGKCDKDGNLIILKKGRKAKVKDESTVEFKKNKANKAKKTGKRGRQAIDRATIEFPTDSWTLKQAHALNQGMAHSTVYFYVKDLVKAGKMIVCGKVGGGRGKPTLLYRMANENDVNEAEPVKIENPDTPF